MENCGAIFTQVTPASSWKRPVLRKGTSAFSGFAPFAPSLERLWRIGDRVGANKGRKCHFQVMLNSYSSIIVAIMLLPVFLYLVLCKSIGMKRAQLNYTHL